MAFSTQKEFFHIPLTNETVEFECVKECVKLKTYESPVDDRSWALNDAVQSNYLRDLVACRIPKAVLEEDNSAILNELSHDDGGREDIKGPSSQKGTDRKDEPAKNYSKRHSKDNMSSDRKKDDDQDMRRRKQANKDVNGAGEDGNMSNGNLGKRRSNQNEQTSAEKERRGDGKTDSGRKKDGLKDGVASSAKQNHGKEGDDPLYKSRNKKNVNSSGADDTKGAGKGIEDPSNEREKRNVNKSGSDHTGSTGKRTGDPSNKIKKKNVTGSDSEDTAGDSKETGDLSSERKKKNLNGSGSDGIVGSGKRTGAPYEKVTGSREGEKRNVNDGSSDDTSGAGKKTGHQSNEGKKRNITGSGPDDTGGAGKRTGDPSREIKKKNVTGSDSEDTADDSKETGDLSSERKKKNLNGSGSDGIVGSGKRTGAPYEKVTGSREGEKRNVNDGSSDDTSGAGKKTGHQSNEGKKRNITGSGPDDTGGAGKRTGDPSNKIKKENATGSDSDNTENTGESAGDPRKHGDGERGRFDNTKSANEHRNGSCDLKSLKTTKSGSIGKNGAGATGTDSIIRSGSCRIKDSSVSLSRSKERNVQGMAKQDQQKSAVGSSRGMGPCFKSGSRSDATISGHVKKCNYDKTPRSFCGSVPGEMDLRSDVSLIHIANTAIARLNDMISQKNNLEKLLEDAHKQLNDTTMERNELRERLKGFKEMEWKIDEMKKRSATAATNSDALRDSLTDQTRFIQSIEDEFLRAENYYEKKLQILEQNKQEAQSIAYGLKVELQRVRREAALVSPLRKQNLEMCQQIERLKGALREYDFIYKQLLKKVQVFKNQGYSFERNGLECTCLCPDSPSDAKSCSNSLDL